MARASASTTAARGKRPPRADRRAVLSRKLRSGYALPAFPAPAAPSPIPTPSGDHLTPTTAVAVFCSALWSGFSPPLTTAASRSPRCFSASHSSHCAPRPCRTECSSWLRIISEQRMSLVRNQETRCRGKRNEPRLGVCADSGPEGSRLLSGMQILTRSRMDIRSHRTINVLRIRDS